MMKAFAQRCQGLQALASTGMQPAQLMALAFRDLADIRRRSPAQHLARSAARDDVGKNEAR